MGNMRQLTDEELARQDFVDNAIYDLINTVNPVETEIDWDIEIIGEVRDKINFWLTNRLGICSEQEFYPFIGIHE
jgi:hypothetical protein